MDDHLIVTEAMPSGQPIVTIEIAGVELARVTASLAQAITLPTLDALRLLRTAEQWADSFRLLLRKNRFYLVWQNRFCHERCNCMMAVGELLIQF
jgi:hypothetical protein